MSVVGLNFEFFDLPMTKDLLKITDDQDDKLLKGTIGLKAERWVKNKLIPYEDSFPLDTEDQETAISAACNRAAADYKKRNSSFEAAKMFKSDANEDLDALILALKARPTGRTKRISVKTTFRSKQLFAQTKK